ncbi:TPA: YlcI/YnfO family protein [Citrobacter freundii]|uniref:YlcI/YnfO family protein n=1 Tax=Citrobacter freundii TaxID=546 RepID=UPI001906B953|nr:YlcI/YnfO family protein [Citrobacter freundii]MBJ8946550.1 hypothetical protein [Citrobacter freundii]
MAKNTINDKSKQISIRIPHDVLDSMEALKRQDESSAGFIVTAMRGEIARRQTGGTTEDAIISALETMVDIRERAAIANKEIDTLIKIAESEIKNIKNHNKD